MWPADLHLIRISPGNGRKGRKRRVLHDKKRKDLQEDRKNPCIISDRIRYVNIHISEYTDDNGFKQRKIDK